MAPDKYTAVWLSHSSISDFLKCPRSYYLKHVYKDPKTRHKVQLMSPPLALGAAVHNVIDGQYRLPTKERFSKSLVDELEVEWKKFEGKKGGFFDFDSERKYLDRARKMLRNIEKNPGPLADLAVRISMDLPYYFISPEDNLILCGKVDWMQYLPESDSLHVIDFKTSKSEEDPESLQLPIYYLLVTNTQKRPVSKASYWYLEFAEELTPKELPDPEESKKRILEIGKQIKTARALDRFKCPTDGCRYCKDMETILNGEAEYIGEGEYGVDIYVLPPKVEQFQEDSVIL